MKNKKYELTIGWLYPELMSTYGDRGNIIVLQKRCERRGINVGIKRIDLGFKINDLKKCDLLFMGGAQDQQQKIVAIDLQKKSSTLKDMIENSIPGLYICGAYQFLGRYYKEAEGAIINGLGLLDLYTESPGENAKRLIGNIATRIDLVGSTHWNYKVRPSNTSSNCDNTLVGFENHGGRTYLGKNIKPLGKVLVGFGNNGKDKTEGVIYKNSFGSYLHGPILPKNPHFTDMLIKLALEKKYPKSPIDLSPLDDSLEIKARNAIAQTLNIKL